MAKLTRAEKIELYERRKKGERISDLAVLYGMNRVGIQYLIRLIDTHGIEILREHKNRYYSPEYKLDIINRILVNHESIKSTAVEIGLSSDGMIHNWIREYKENGYNVIEKKRGRPVMIKPKNIHPEPVTPEERVKELEKQLEYVEAENEYLKKLHAVVKQRVEREKKKKPK